MTREQVKDEKKLSQLVSDKPWGGSSRNIVNEDVDNRGEKGKNRNTNGHSPCCHNHKSIFASALLKPKTNSLFRRFIVF